MTRIEASNLQKEVVVLWVRSSPAGRSGPRRAVPSSARKITVLCGLEMNYNDEHGYPLHFQFENRRHTLLGSNPMNATWLFMVLTNDGSGTFVPALLVEPVNFRTPDDGGYYEFWMRD